MHRRRANILPGKVVVCRCCRRHAHGRGLRHGCDVRACRRLASAGRMRTLCWRRRRRDRWSAAARRTAGRYGEWLSRHAEVDWSDVVSTAALHRTHFASRASVLARDASEAVEALRALGEGRSHAAVSLGEAKGERGGKLAFLFTGQGAQQLGMGRALLESCAAFRSAFEEVCGHFDELLEMPLRDVLVAEEGSEAALRLNETAYAQPALFALEVALFR